MNGIEGLGNFDDLGRKFSKLREVHSSEQFSEAITEAARELAEKVRQAGAARNVPSDALEDIFISRGRQKGSQVAALVGLRKRGRGQPFAHGYREWIAGSQRGRFRKTVRTSGRRGKRLAAAGRKIGENLATMWEVGTSKMRARPFFRSAVESNRDSVVTRMGAGIRAALESLSER